MRRLPQDLSDGAQLDKPPGRHHPDPVRDPLHDRQIMGDEENREAQGPLKVAQQPQDLHLDRHVERGRRLIGDEEQRMRRERHAPARGAEARRRAAEWLRRVGIPQPEMRLAAYPHEFSGGMQQRACLAMALAGEPALLVADEPTTALDVTVQVQILRLIRDLQRTLQLSVLLISHDLTVVERVAHRVGVMAAGRLVELGAVEQVLQHPAHPYTRELLRYRSMLSLGPASGDGHG